MKVYGGTNIDSALCAHGAILKTPSMSVWRGLGPMLWETQNETPRKNFGWSKEVAGSRKQVHGYQGLGATTFVMEDV